MDSRINHHKLFWRGKIVRHFIVLAIIGFLAQFIDGVLGMGFGVTSSTLLLGIGIAPAVASASVHLVEIVTTGASSMSHIKLGNVDRQTAYKLIFPGSIGAFAGACFLSNLPALIMRPYISLFLLFLGIFVLIRFLIMVPTKKEKKRIELSNGKSILLGLAAGFADATGGGGWGTITTPVLLSKKGISPRIVIGTVNTSEFFIAVSATLGFLISLGWEEVNWFWVLAFMLGGIIAAPMAALMVRRLPAHLLGVLAGGLIVLINIRTIALSWGINSSGVGIIYFLVIIVIIVSFLTVIIRNKR
jgi:uncharacterized protein